MGLPNVTKVQTTNKDINQLQTNIVPPLNQLLSRSSVMLSNSITISYTGVGSTVFQPLTGLSVSYNCTGLFSVKAELVPDGTANPFHISLPNSFTPGLQIRRDSTIIGTVEMNQAATTRDPFTCTCIDLNPPAGTHIYQVYAAIDVSESFSVINARLCVYEI